MKKIVFFVMAISILLVTSVLILILIKGSKPLVDSIKARPEIIELVSQAKTTNGIFSGDALVGLNVARTKVSDQLGFCTSAVIKIGTYQTTDDLKQVAFSFLKNRNKNISLEDLEVDTAPFMNFTTNPPTPAKGETLRTLLQSNGTVEPYYVESSQTTMVKIGADFYNRQNRMAIDLNCVGYRPIDNACIGPLEFTKGVILMGVAYPC